MQLKKYQQRVLNDLAEYIRQVKKDNDLIKGYGNYWLNRGIDVNNLTEDLCPYDNSIKDVCHVTFKVPTAGGKTFIACNALKTIFDNIDDNLPKVVAWFVPSDAIYKQTYNNLSNPNHPYRQTINALFNNSVCVVDKEAALMGQGIGPNQITSQLTIFVLSIDSFATNKAEGRRAYKENSFLAEYPKYYKEQTEEEKNNDPLKDTDDTSLIKVIRYLTPVVIIDESHNFKSNLRIDALNDINPRFVLDLTATPRKKSNIISFVDAIELKKANMVKLPVILYNQKNTDEVIANAIRLRNSLEKIAKEEEKETGKYIRPIILFQAEPKNDNDSVTFDKIKSLLVEAGIDEQQIKIKTAKINEIKNIDLTSIECPVRYIITVNALKEGWDCPFAYILASIANRTSKVDVQQVVGRILRLPYTRKHNSSFLNCSYVFTSSNDFKETVENVIEGLNNAGFNGREIIAEQNNAEENSSETQTPEFELTLFNNTTENEPNIQQENEVAIDKIKEAVNDNKERDINTNNILQQAKDSSDKYEQQVSESTNDNIPNDIKSQMPTYKIKEQYNEIAKNMQLPKFKIKNNHQNNLFSNENEYWPLNKTMLTEGFVLTNADKNINFGNSVSEIAQVDIEETNKGVSVPRRFSPSENFLKEFREKFVQKDNAGKIESLTYEVAKSLKFDNVHEPQISQYIRDVLKNKNTDELMDLLDNKMLTIKAFKDKINILIAEHQKKKFQDWINNNKIECKPSYKFAESIIITKQSSNPKGLYEQEEGDINKLEAEVIRQIANLDNVLFWHRNFERGKGFYINGFINHYPDFIVVTKKNNIVLVETKGDNLNNPDSNDKIFLGNTWANKAGNNYKYFMVFENANVRGALNITEFLNILKDL